MLCDDIKLRRYFISLDVLECSIDRYNAEFIADTVHEACLGSTGGMCR